jgi:hypothetical protein
MLNLDLKLAEDSTKGAEAPSVNERITPTYKYKTSPFEVKNGQILKPFM